MISEPKVYRVGSLTYSRRQLGALFLWLIWGDICFFLMEAVIPAIMPIKFKHLDAPAWAIGLIMTTLPTAITAVLNPIVSFKSDRFRSRWGRRIPFMILTMPPLVLAMWAMGFADSMGLWLHGRVELLAAHASPRTTALVVIGIMSCLFAFFNAFVCAVFWYFFNDVVPEPVMARFMSWFQMASNLAGFFYNMFLFRYGATHPGAILLGGGLLYLFGFGATCLIVKEPRYAPAPTFNRATGGFFDSLIAAISTYTTECFVLPHYWYLFAIGIFIGAWSVTQPFLQYYYLATGISFAEVGEVLAVLSLASTMMLPIAGWLADRYHPVRIVIIGFALEVVLALPVSLIWLFWHPPARALWLGIHWHEHIWGLSRPIAYWAWMVMTVVVIAPCQALWNMNDPPLFMRTLPRSRYGQFCSANAMLCSASTVIFGVPAGLFFDYLGTHVGKERAFLYLPVWQLVCFAGMLVAVLLFYRSWKRYGGDRHYAPPLPAGLTDDVSAPAEGSAPEPAGAPGR